MASDSNFTSCGKKKREFPLFPVILRGITRWGDWFFPTIGLYYRTELFLGIEFYAGFDDEMKTFEELFRELKTKAAAADPNSGTVKELSKGKHFIGKKVVEEAGEVWMAAEYEGREKTAEEISQLFYHLQVMMIANDLELEDVYKYL